MPAGIYKHAPGRIEKMREQIMAAGDACIEWPGALTLGYGTCWYQNKNCRAHRAAFHIFYGRFPDDMACHSCDNKKCINPKHLFEGSQADNMADALAKGRFPRGENSAMTKHAKLDVGRVLDLACFKELAHKDIAQHLGFSQPYVTRIINRQRRYHAS